MSMVMVRRKEPVLKPRVSHREAVSALRRYVMERIRDLHGETQ